MQNKKTKIKLEEKDTTTRKASLAGQGSSTRTGSPREEDVHDAPAGACRGSRRQNHLTNYSATTHVINQCGVKPQSV